MKKQLLSLSLLLCSLFSYADSGIFESFAIVNGAYYDLGSVTANPNFSGFNFGILPGGSTITVGGQIKTYKNGTDNICGGFVTYAIFPFGTLPTTGTPVSLAYGGELNGGNGDQLWETTPGNVVTLPTAPGIYSFAIGASDFGSASGGGCATNPFHTVAPLIATFTIAVPMPVRLSSISGMALGANNSINWQSESEVNVSRYEVQKSRDNKTWATIETLPAKGDASRSTTYSISDVATFKTSYYRLKMIDKDMRFEYSKTINVLNEGNTKVSIYPNPIVNTLTISSLEDVATIHIYDVKGTKIMDQNVGNGTISLENMASGLYFVSLINENGTVVLNQKVMKN